MLITVPGHGICKTQQGETILAALARSGIVFQAPCGGQGTCGKCLVTLLDGQVQLNNTPENPKPGESFRACMGTAVSDISIKLPDEGTIETTEILHKKNSAGKIRRAGVGIDIGTTTIQAELIDLDTETPLETLTVFNAQRVFGADVMSRINAAKQGHTKDLHRAVNSQIENILRHFISAWNLREIELCTVSGNTAMLHLFTGIDPSGMGEAPFTPVFLEEKHIAGKELSISAKEVIVLSGISAFVGADIVSGLAFLNIAHNSDSLFVDIGTNGEMALWKQAEQTLLCCSVAAGPCFEGAGISCGMGALPGAINRIYPDVSLSGALRYTTLGDIPPRGICASALVDAIAVMNSLSVIDETGALKDEYAQTGFPLAEGIAVTQADIRQFQLAKSAICSGIILLCKKAGLENPGKLETAYISGGIGLYINLDNAVSVGLFPPEFVRMKETAICGNTSLKGAVRSLTDTTLLQRCREIIAKSQTVELAANSDFSEAFMENMFF